MASRKRRSSILKSKARAPLTEVEFNSPTPTDTTSKSRRVSFSRRTGIAEFVVNEATTTWRNIYEQNRSLESSGNDSDLHRATAVTNKSLRQQFTEVEAEIDCTTFGNTAAHNPRDNLTLFNDMNFTEQLASLDCMTDERSLKLPTQNFDVSVMGEKSRVFSDVFTNPVIVEHTGKIEVDFSMIQQVRQTESDTDDLSDIAKDVEKSNPSIASSFLNDFNNRSHYVEVDLNVTKGVHDISDMSITNTIPNVQSVTEFSNRVEDKNKSSLDWTAEKENIIVESFSMHTEVTLPRSDENVLVFDGKKLKVASLYDRIDDIVNNTPEEKEKKSFNHMRAENILQPLPFDRHRDLKAITEMNQSLSIEIAKQHKLYKNMVSGEVDLLTDMSLAEEDNKKKSTVSVKDLLVTKVSHGERSFLYENSGENGKEMIGNIPTLPSDRVSLLQKNSGIAITDKLLAEKDTVPKEPGVLVLDNTNRKTLCPESDNPNNMSKILQLHQQPKEFPQRKTIVLNHDDDLPNFTLDTPPLFDQSATEGLRQTIVFDTADSFSNIPIVQGVQEYTNKLPNQSIPKTFSEVIQHDDLANMSITEAFPQRIEYQEKRRTILFEEHDNLADMSMTQAIPQPVLQERSTVIFDKYNSLAGIPMTESMHQLVGSEKRTMVFDKDDNMANMSMTQALTQKVTPDRRTMVYDKDDNMTNMPMTQGLTRKVAPERKTMVFDKDDDIADMSMMQALPQKVAPETRTILFDKDDNMADMSTTQAVPAKVAPKRRTILFDNDDNIADMSMTQTLPHKLAPERRTIVFDKDDMSMTQALTQSVAPERRTMVFDKDDMSMTQALPQSVAPERRTILFDKDDNVADMSMTQALPQKLAPERRTLVFDKDDMSLTQAIPQRVAPERRTILFDNDYIMADMSTTQALPARVAPERRTILFDKDDNIANMSMTQTLPHKLAPERRTIVFDKDDMSMTQALTQSVAPERRTMVFDKDDMSMTQALPQSVAPERRTILFDKDDNVADMSMTQALPQKVAPETRNMISEREDNMANMLMTQALSHKVAPERRTMVFDKDDMSMTQALPQSVAPERRTILFGKDDNVADMSMPHALPQKMAPERRTLVFDNDDNMADMSMTQALPQRVVPERRTILFYKDGNVADMSMPHALPQKMAPERRTMVFDKDDMSMTQALPLSVAPERRTILFDKDDNVADMSMTQALPQKVAPETRNMISEREVNMANMLMTQALSHKVAPERRTMVFKKDVADMSMTQALPQKVSPERITIAIDDDMENLSIIQSIPTAKTVLEKHNEMANDSIAEAIPQNIINRRLAANLSTAQAVIVVNQMSEDKRKTVLFDKSDNIAKRSQSIPQRKNSDEFRVLESDRDGKISDISLLDIVDPDAVQVLKETRPFDKYDSLATFPKNRGSYVAPMDNEVAIKNIIYTEDNNMNPSALMLDKPDKTRTIIPIDEEADKSITQAVPQDILLQISRRISLVHDASRYGSTANMSLKKNNSKKSMTHQQFRRSLEVKTVETSKTIDLDSNVDAENHKPYLNLIPNDNNCPTLQVGQDNVKEKAQDVAPQAIEPKSRNIKEIELKTNVKDKKPSPYTDKDRAQDIIPDDKGHLNKSSSQDIHNCFLNNSRNNGRLAINFDDEIKPEPTVGKLDKSDRIAFNNTNDLLNLLTKYTEPPDNNEKENVSAELKLGVKESQVTLKGEDNMNIDMFIFKEDAGQSSHFPEKALSSHVDEDKSVGKICVAHNTARNLSTEPTNHMSVQRTNNSMAAHTSADAERRKMINYSTVNLMEMSSSNSTENKDSAGTSNGRKNGFTCQIMKKSIILSREEILNNISMAQTLLQQSRFNIDETDTTMDEESVDDLSMEVDPHTTGNKSMRLSKDVVKTLNFDDDDSLCRVQQKRQNGLPSSVVQKSNFSSDFHPKLNTNIPKVIPQGINDQEMDSIKDLMAHLVKPTADLPLYYDNQPIKESNIDSVNASLQCNIETPSQIDIEDEQLQTQISQPSVEVQADLTCNNVTEGAKKSRVSFNPEYLPSGELNMDRMVDSTLAQITNRHRYSVKEESEDYSSSGSSKRVLENDQSVPRKPIIFDRNNPLNNIVLASFSCNNSSPVPKTVSYASPHLIMPKEEMETGGEIKFDAYNPLNNVCLNVDSVSKTSTQDELGIKSSDSSVARLKQSIMMDALQQKNCYNLTSNIKAPAVDRATDVKQTKKLKNSEVNTVIAMKQNEELLENTSAITLVDDTLEGTALDADLDTDAEPQSHTTIATDKTSMTYTTDPNAPLNNVEILYMVGNDDFSEGETTEGDSKTRFKKSAPRSPNKHAKKEEIKLEEEHNNSRKRNLSPRNNDKHKNCTLGMLELTPRPQEKMQKMSTSQVITQSDYAELCDIVRGATKMNSPEKIKPRVSISPEKHLKNSPNRASLKKSRSPTKTGSPKAYEKQQSPTKTICKINHPSSNPVHKEDLIEKVDTEALSSQSDIVISNFMCHMDHINLRDRNIVSKLDTLRMSTLLGDTTAILEDKSECDDDDDHIMGISSGSTVTSNDSLQKISKSNDIISKIDELPFMGTWCCEWERDEGDTWVFLLMHSRVRLRVKLALGSENELGAVVMSHTPVESIHVDSMLGEPSHTVALLCVRACMEALKAAATVEECDRAARVPALVTRCAGVVRAAMRWGRAMQQARMHLAYTLAPDGLLKLKVANVPLRSVWEVSMRIALGANEECAGGVWPRATNVRITSLSADVVPTADDLAALLKNVPHGWGEVPTTVWKIFKYLKHKTKDDDLILALMR